MNQPYNQKITVIRAQKPVEMSSEIFNKEVNTVKSSNKTKAEQREDGAEEGHSLFVSLPFRFIKN